LSWFASTDLPPVFTGHPQALTTELTCSRFSLTWTDHPLLVLQHGRFLVTSRGPLGPLACPRILTPARTRSRSLDLRRRASLRHHGRVRPQPDVQSMVETNDQLCGDGNGEAIAI